MTRAAAVMASVFIIFVTAGFAGAQELPGAGSDGTPAENLTNAGSAYAAEYRNGTFLEEPFLDVRDRRVDLNPTFDERGLLSIAFHPAFRENGRVFAFYSAPLREEGPEGRDCTNRLSEFRVDPGNTDRVDMTSEKILIEIDKPQSTHNGGSIAFSPRDGYLYVPLGDGGGAGDSGTGHTPETGNAQDLTNIYGKVLRIDVGDISAGNVPEPPENAAWTTGAGVLYGFPADNPFVANESIPPEIYAYGSGTRPSSRSTPKATFTWPTQARISSKRSRSSQAAATTAGASGRGPTASTS